MRLHASLEARRRYGLGDFPLEEEGSLRLPSARDARVIAARIRDVRESAGTAWRDVRGGQIHALALINEIFHRVIALYREERLPGLDAALPDALARRSGSSRLDALLRRLAGTFPPPSVAAGGDPALVVEGRPWPGRRGALLAELIVLWLANRNTACDPFADLFDDEPLRREPGFSDLLASIREFFDAAPRLGAPYVGSEEGLLDLLRSPAVAEPHSLHGQLRYIHERWGFLLRRIGLEREVLSGLDLLREEESAFRLPPGGFAPARGEVPDLAALASEEERFSPDSDWMPRVVLMARNAHVWLAQLGRRHGRPIERLDQIPDGELERLARWGITALWLIGLWERSLASREIKRLRGNPDAAASAYSIREYAIAADLGGEEAWRSLRDRAGRLGIRLASDMVPNHMGIDSRWVLEHPERFLSLPHSPYPSYRFSGPDLSPDPATGLFLEDHYADASDAAVVFRRLDRRTGEDRFVYHGNDGTATPWNDTAQLDYLNPETREAVIRTILAVARQFPIIRFDAAMTLARRHYQRLWFPPPGAGGAIPSRAEHGLTQEEFDRRMPLEFWREVVDRAAREAPDTLLLAEAFWLMEGYFVRTLGMHRVYNSAFMNMLRDEENANYRLVIRNTIEFDPEILGRYVNFMSNPDERTAIEQFGDGDKYLGVATLLATLPGLPMFGHGQIEGLTERYGMEFRRPFRDEEPNAALVARHEAEIAPLLARRGLFAGSRDFLLFDLFTDAGVVDENVFAYSNRSGSDSVLVVYHNRFAETAGWIRESAAYAAPKGDGGRALRRRTLGDGLGVPAEDGAFVLMRDHASRLEFLRPARQIHEQGLRLELRAYSRHVFLEIRTVRDSAGEPWGRLCERLGGRGVPNAHAALEDLVLATVRETFAAVAGPGALRRLIAEPPEGATERLVAFFGEAARLTGANGSPAEAAARAVRALQRIRSLAGETDAPSPPRASGASAATRALREVLRSVGLAGGLAGRAIFRELASLLEPPAHPIPSGASRASRGPTPASSRPTPASSRATQASTGPAQASLGPTPDACARTRPLIERWRLAAILTGGIEEAGAEAPAARRAATGAVALLPHGVRTDRANAHEQAGAVLSALLDDPAVREWIGVNEYEGATWFHRESFEELLSWLAALAALEAAETLPSASAARALARGVALAAPLREAMEGSGHRVDGLRAGLASLRPSRRAPASSGTGRVRARPRAPRRS